MTGVPRGSAGAPESKRSRTAVVRSALTAWLARPLTSFHLLLSVFGLLVVIGLVMVLSASSVVSASDSGSPYLVFKKQLVFVSVGLLAFWIVLRVSPNTMRKYSPVLLVGTVLLLVLVLTPLGSGANGRTHAWFVLGPLSLQPVELAKLALGLWGAHVLVIKRPMLHQYRHLLVPVVPVALLMFTLVMMQPDLGSTITLGVVLMALLWFAGAPMRLFGVLALGSVTGVVALTYMASYRRGRLSSFLDPTADPLGAGLQARQGLYALADGGLVGRGLGQGAAKWSYLPYAHNDFIFAVIGEELGLVGCLVVLGLFALLAYVGLRIAARNTDPWIRVAAASLTVWLVLQAAINIGYVVGVLPVTGIPLPMISSGGTSIVITMIVFGLLANFARHEPEAIAAFGQEGQGWFGRLFRLPMPAPYRPAARRRPVRPSPPPRSTGRSAPGRAVPVHAVDERRRTRRTTASSAAASSRDNRRRGTRRRAEGGHR